MLDASGFERWKRGNGDRKSCRDDEHGIDGWHDNIGRYQHGRDNHGVGGDELGVVVEWHVELRDFLERFVSDLSDLGDLGELSQ